MSGSNPYEMPQAEAATASPQAGDATGGVIPYKNMPALIAYYLGIFSGLPCVFFLGLPAFILGIMGLRKAAQNPAVKGKVHAWIGIIVGGGFFLFWGAIVLLVLIASASNVR